ncbi:MAG: magnesium-translocating P-type ATPase, partial [Bacillota bacterium]|nr:magnesium-translocating P-type ATPase [Bacillota bacterium]
YFQTGWFMEGLLTQTLIVHLIRTSKVPFIESRASKPLIFSTIIISLIGLTLPFTGLSGALGMVGMPLLYLPYLAGVIIVYSTLVQLMKKVYIRHYGSWI